MEFKEFNGKTVNILGTEYKIEIHKISEDEYMRNSNLAGACSDTRKVIAIGDVNEKPFFDFNTEEGKRKFFNLTLMHEIIHAFLSESGLMEASYVFKNGWAKNEEMVDWFAIQSPKIFKVYQEVGCL